MGDVAMSSSREQALRGFALMHIGSGKDIDDVKNEQRYGHVVGLTQRHKWGLEPGVGTPLQLCSSYGAVEPSLLLINAKADVNFSHPALGYHGAPPLHMAIKSGSVDMVRALLEKGANRDMMANMGHGDINAYDYARACAVNNPTEERVVISHLVGYFNMPFGPVETTPLPDLTNPINAENPVTFVKQLIGTGRDINDIHGGLKWAQKPDRTPLAAVAGAGDVEAVRLLLAA